MIERIKVGPRFLNQPEPHLVGDDLAIQQPFLGFGDGQCFHQQVMQLHHFHPTALQLPHEVPVIALGVVHPEQVIEQQVIVVRWRQSFLSKPGAANEDLVQLAHLGIHAVRCLCHVRPFSKWHKCTGWICHEAVILRKIPRS